MRAWWRAHRRCTACGKQDERTLRGNTRCFECYDKRKEQAERAKGTEKHRDQTHARCGKAKEQRQQRAEQKLCTNCGKPLAVLDAGYKQCCECRAKERKRKAKHFKPKNRARWPEMGLCWQCAAPLDPTLQSWHGKSKLCPKCYERACNHAEKGRKAKGLRKVWLYNTTPGGITVYQKALERRRFLLNQESA